MKLVRYHDPRTGLRLGRVEDGFVYAVVPESLPGDEDIVLACIQAADEQNIGLTELLSWYPMEDEPAGTLDALNIAPDNTVPHLVQLFAPPETWAFGVTYKRSAEWRSDDTSVGARIYDFVYASERPEMFYKGHGARIVGPNEFLCVRSDSSFTATEPELAYVIGAQGTIFGYTACNDFSAWDIERENPLYLPQSKIFRGCCSFGPSLVTPDEVDPYNLNIACTIHRNGSVLYEGSVNSSQIGRRFETLNEYLIRDNPVPAGTLVSTGTGLIVPREAAHKAGDIVEVTIEGIGMLRNPVRQL